MTVLDAIKDAVEKRVVESLLSHVLESLEMSHAKRGHATGCDCSYCLLKRRATADIGYIRPHLHSGIIRGIFGSDFIEVQSVFDTRNERQMQECDRLLDALHNDATVEQFSRTVTLDGFVVIHVTRRKRPYYDNDEMYFRVKDTRERLAARWREELREEKQR